MDANKLPIQAEIEIRRQLMRLLGKPPGDPIGPLSCDACDDLPGEFMRGEDENAGRGVLVLCRRCATWALAYGHRVEGL